MKRKLIVAAYIQGQSREQLAERLRKGTGVPIDVIHRDVDRVTMTGKGGDPDGGHST